MINLSHSMGFFFFCLNRAYPKGKSCVVPIKQNQPQPIRPNRGEISRKKNQIKTTKLITPQKMECHMKPKLKILKKAGVSSKKRILLTVFQNESLFSFNFQEGFQCYRFVAGFPGPVQNSPFSPVYNLYRKWRWKRAQSQHLQGDSQAKPIHRS